MSRDGEPNVQFNQAGFRITNTAEYKDPTGNSWRIDIVGDEESVNRFLTEGRIYCAATPLSKDEVQKWLQLIKERPSKPPTPEPEKTTGWPVLETHVTLVELAIKVPYLISYDLDPTLSAPKSHEHTIRLLSGQALPSFGPPVVNGGTIAIEDLNRIMGRLWSVLVVALTGTPTYRLRGNFVVVA